MPELGRKTPCKDCPWRVTSLPGYLGEDDPVHFYWQSVTHENEMPCHEQIDYGDPDWQETQLPGTDLCAGMLIHFRNSCKMPVTPKMTAAVKEVKPSAAVFLFVTDYMRHHLPRASEEEIKAACQRATAKWDSEWMSL